MMNAECGMMKGIGNGGNLGLDRPVKLGDDGVGGWAMRATAEWGQSWFWIIRSGLRPDGLVPGQVACGFSYGPA